MKRDPLNDLSKELINSAEHDCESDPEMCEAAGMVLVGDVYALRVSAGVKPKRDEEPLPPAADDDDIEPFIR